MHLKLVHSILMLLLSAVIFGQEASEIYLFDLEESDDGIITISHPINISNNPGYDNQPSFTEDNNSILYTSFRDGQTDIMLYDIGLGFTNWITNSPENEYSPKPYPGKKKSFTCVRLEKNGTQLLYKYYYKNKQPEVLIPNTQVGYYTWLDEDNLVTFVIDEEETEALYVSNFNCGLKYPIQFDIGRSFEKIPHTGFLSFISKSHEVPEIFSINPKNSEKKYLVDALKGSEDMVWTLKGTILMGKGGTIYKFHPGIDKKWTPVNLISGLPVNDITRMAVSPNGKKIAIVVSEIETAHIDDQD